MELSVLERQRAVLRRIYPHDHDHDHEHDHHSLWPNPKINDLQHRKQCNSTSAPKSSKKRNINIAQFGLEEESDVAEEESDITTKPEMETSTNTSSKASELQKPDYIHVRARRGQATDSHSLAERARREKITKKMKCLQDLVPGCNRVTGKAGMLDEIINYVQSLQKQVEFLSMKLATVNPRLDFNIDNIFAKEIIPAYIASLQPTNQYNPMQLGNEQLFLDPSCPSQLQQLSGWETDCQNLFSAGFQ